MRFVLPALLTALFVATPTSAQRSIGSQFVGLSGGATLSDLEGAGVSSSSRWGGTAGVFGGYRPSYGSVVMLEVNWAQKGGGDAGA